MANVIGTAYIQVIPVLTGFAQKVKRDVTQALAAQSAATSAAVGASMRKAGQAIDKAGAQTSKFGASWSRNITVPIAATSGAIFKVSMDFDKSMHNIIGLVGESQAQVDIWSKQILAMAPQLAKSPTELADALYYVTSAGFHGTEAMKVLTASAKAATAGLGNTGVVADALTSVVNAYGKTGLTAARATDILVAAVREGKLEADELAPVLGMIVPIASAMGISFEDVAATLAVMSKTGLDASESAVSLNAVMSTLLHPSVSARKELDKVGLSMAELRDVAAKPGGVLQVMRILNNTFKDDDEALSTVVPNVRAFRGVMNVLAQDSKGVDAVFKGVRNSTGLLDKAFAAAQDTAKFKLDSAMAQLKVTMIVLGGTVMPIVADSLHHLTSALVVFTDWWKTLSPMTQTIIVRLLMVAAAIGPVIYAIGKLTSAIGIMIQVFGLVIEFGPMVGAAIAAALGPIGWVILAIAALGVALVIAYKKSETFRNIVNAAWAGVVAGAKIAFNYLMIGVHAVGNAFVWLWENAIRPTWHGIQIVISTAWNVIRAVFNAMMPAVRALGAIYVWLWRNIIQPVWEGIKLNIRIAVALIKVMFGIIHIELIILGRVFMWLWRNVVEPVFRGIGRAIQEVWQRVILPTFNLIRITIINPLAGAFRWLLNSVIRPVMSAIGSVISSVWNRVIKPAFQALGRFIRDSVVPAFRAGVQAIAAAWNKLRDAAKKPIEFIVNTVINRGIIDTYNKLADAFNVKHVGHVSLPRGWAAGGRFTEPTAIVGEGNTSRPEYVIPTDPRHRQRALSLYDELGVQLMQSGGILGLLAHPIRSARDLFGTAMNQLDRFSDSAFGRLAAAMPRLIASKVADFVKSKLIGALGGGAIGGIGWQKQWSVVHAAFPWAQLFSSFRPHARTVSGNTSYHALGRAIDVSPAMQIFNWIRAVYGANTKELIFSPAGSRQIKNGRAHTYTGAVRADHWDHVHWAYDRGGILPPGLTMAYNGTGRNETVLPPGISGPRAYEDLAAAIAQALMQHGVGRTDVIVAIDSEEFKRVVRIETKKQFGSAANSLQVGRR